MVGETSRYFPNALGRFQFVSTHGVADITVPVGKAESVSIREASERGGILGTRGEREVRRWRTREQKSRLWQDIGVGRTTLGAGDGGC